jgi:hypothetical protein
LPSCRCSEFESCSLLWCTNQTQNIGSSVLSKLAAWSVSAASVESLESRGVAKVESPAARLGTSIGTSSRFVLPNPMNSLESESSDGGSSLSEYDLVETNDERRTLAVTTAVRQHDEESFDSSLDSLSSEDEDTTSNDDTNQRREGGENNSCFSDDSSEDDEHHVGTTEPSKSLWQAVEDKATGRTYYFHRYTRETSWTYPPHTRQDGKPVLGAC